MPNNTPVTGYGLSWSDQGLTQNTPQYGNYTSNFGTTYNGFNASTDITQSVNAQGHSDSLTSIPTVSSYQKYGQGYVNDYSNDPNNPYKDSITLAHTYNPYTNQNSTKPGDDKKVTPPSEWDKFADKAWNWTKQNIGTAGGVTAGALALGTLAGGGNLGNAAAGAIGSGLGSWAGKSLYDWANKDENYKQNIDEFKGWLNKNVSEGAGDYLPAAAQVLGGLAGWGLTKAGSEETEYMQKEAGIWDFFKSPGFLKGVYYAGTPILGGAVSAEAGGVLRGEGSILDGQKPHILRWEDPHVRADAIFGAALAPIGAMKGVQGAKGLGVTGRWGKAALGYGAATSAAAVAEPAIRNGIGALVDLSKAQKEIAKQEAVKNENDNIKYIGLGALGLGALGLAGYHIFKNREDKELEKTAPPKVKVRLKGSDKDVYDDATVEVPLENLQVSNKLQEGVNRGMRKVLRQNNKYSGRKKDPVTGKLIEYQEYVDKYGDPDKKKNKHDSAYMSDDLKQDINNTFTTPAFEMNNNISQY